MSGVLRLAEGSAVVTGAAGGIGRGIALALARRGCSLALVDLDPGKLDSTADEARALGAKATTHVADVADDARVQALVGEVAAEHRRLKLLVNNAGVALGGRFEEIAADDFRWLMGVNFWGVVNMTRAFLPLLRAGEEARIVNLSSLFGLIAPPGQSAYAASKYAVRGLSDSLRHELAGTGVGVTVVHPGGVKTGIARNARLPKGSSAAETRARLRAFEKLLTLPAEAAGETIVRGVERRKDRLIVGRDARAAAFIERLAPVAYWRLMGGRMGKG